MFSERRRRKQLRRLRPGDGSRLVDYRLRHLFSRSLFFLELEEESTGTHVYAVDVRHFADELDDREKGDDGPPPVALYRDGVQVHLSDLPATFAVPGGVVEVASSLYGLSRMHHVSDDGAERTLQPHRSSQEGLRARFENRFPRSSRAVGGVAVVVLLVGLVFGLPQAVAMLSQIDLVAEHVGTFTSPLTLPDWANASLLGAGILAAVERALTLRNHWLVDVDTAWTSLG